MFHPSSDQYIKFFFFKYILYFSSYMNEEKIIYIFISSIPEYLLIVPTAASIFLLLVTSRNCMRSVGGQFDNS